VQAVDFRAGQNFGEAQGFYVPDPPASVANEDPGLSQGKANRNNKTVFWSQ
jgi:hypothetical protein